MELKSGYENRKASVNMLPLIDIVFLLLVFFMYAMLSMVVHRGMDVNLPETGAGALDTREHVTVSIDAEGSLFVDKRPVTIAELPGAVQAAQQGRDDAAVFIEGDEDAPLGTGVRALDVLRRAGVDEVSFSTREPAP